MLFHVLSIVFTVLKLTNTIDWSWWWVLSPSILVLTVWLIVVVIYAALSIALVRETWKVRK